MELDNSTGNSSLSSSLLEEENDTICCSKVTSHPKPTARHMRCDIYTSSRRVVNMIVINSECYNLIAHTKAVVVIAKSKQVRGRRYEKKKGY